MDGKENDLCIKHQYRKNIMNEQNQEKTYNLRISSKNKYNPITKYDSTLTANGFTYNERNDATWEDVNTWGLWARKYNIEMHVVEMKYTRSDTYRQEYFKHNKPVQPAKYRCVYCGRKLLYKDVTVDHLYPINKLMYDPRVQKRAKRHGIDGANDVKNLVCACRCCNSKKGTKMGLWLLRGKIGRHPIVWKIRNLAVGCFVAFCIYTLWVNGYFSGPQTHVFGAVSLLFT